MSIHVRLLVSGLILLILGVSAFAVLGVRHQAAFQATDAAFRNGVDPLSAVQAADRRLEALQGAMAAGEAENGRPLPEREAQTLLAGLAQVLSDLRRATDALPSGTTATRIDELAVRLSTLRAAGGEVTPRLVRRELAGLVDDFQVAAAALERDVAAMRARALDTIGSLDRPLGAGGALILVVGVLLLVYLGRSLVRPLRQAADTLFGLGSPGERRRKDAMGDLRAAVEHAEVAFARVGDEHERSATKTRRRFESDIRQLRRRFDEMLDNMAEAFCVLDERRMLQAANHPFRLLFPHARIGMGEIELRVDPDMARVLDGEGDPARPYESSDGRVFQVRRWHGENGIETLAFDDVTQRQSSTRDIERLMAIDSLTGLPNRTRLLDRLDALLSSDEASDFAVMVVDIEGFRNFNTMLGHRAGDELLTAVGERLAALLLPGDVIGRLGNDEFALVQRALPQPEASQLLCRRILDDLAGSTIVVGGRPHAVRAAIGVTTILAGQGRHTDALEVLHDCDIALQKAKADPDAHVSVYEPGLRHALVSRRRLVADLREALERQEFELFFQPIVDVRRRRVTGFEALARWTHPQRGPVSPGVFVPVMEEAGLIVPLGRLVLERACRHAASWPGDLQVSVNLSPLQFRDPGLLGDIGSALRRSGLAPGRLQIEVTESLFLDDAEGVVETLGRLRALGLVIAMDDFGTGYSSLGYLSRFRFDKIKIDQSFVRALDRPENLAIVRAVLGMATAMRMEVVAEGVESEAQRATLAGEGCTMMQGYLFSRPHSVAELPRTLLRLGTRLEDERPPERPAAAPRREAAKGA